MNFASSPAAKRCARPIWLPGRIIGTLKPQRILIVLVKSNSVYCGCDFIGIAHFSARCDTAERQMPPGTIRKPAHEFSDIGIGNSQGTIAAGAVLFNHGHIGNHPRVWPHQRQSGMNYTRGQIANRSIGHARWRSTDALLVAQIISSRGRKPVSNTAPTAAMATEAALPMQPPSTIPMPMSRISTCL